MSLQIGNHVIFGRPGKLRLLGFANHARMASFRDALEHARVNGGLPTLASVRHNQTKLGFGFSVEQVLTRDQAYYALLAFDALWLSFGYQFHANPAYNADRGPVSIFSLRVHVEL